MTVTRKNITALFVFVFLLFAQSVEAAPHTTFAPTSCGLLDTTDLKNHVDNQIDDRILGVTASDSTKSLWSTRGNNTSGWTWNPNVWTNNGTTSIDWTGMSPYNTDLGFNKAGTLVTPKHIVFANHYTIANNSTVTFVDSDNNVVNRTLIKSANVTNTDIRIGELDSEVPSNITHYPVVSNVLLANKLIMAGVDESNKASVVVFDQQDHAAIHILLEWANDLGPLVEYIYPLSGSRVDFYEEIISGDSGNPVFLIIDNKPVLLATNYHAAFSFYPADGPNYGYYIDEINQILSGWGSSYGISVYDLNCFDDLNNNVNPTFIDKTVSLDENSSASTTVTTISATDSDGDTVTFSIVSGNSLGGFYIGEVSYSEGAYTASLLVNDSDVIDYETTPTFNLVIRATDENSNYTDATYTINLNNDNESEPTISVSTSTLSIAEDYASTTEVLSIASGYDDDGNSLVYAIESGNTDNVFGINVNNGQITATNATNLDYETTQSYQLVVSATESATVEEYTATTTLNITITDVIEVVVPPPSGGGGGGGGSSRKEEEQEVIEEVVTVEGSTTTPATSVPFSNMSIEERTELKRILTVLNTTGAIDDLVFNILIQFIDSSLVLESSPLSCPNIVNLYKFNRPLNVGSVGVDVLQLQKILNNNGFIVSSSGLGSPGNETTYFGQKTQDALKRLQNSCSDIILKPVGLISGTGFFGQSTINFLNP